MNLYDLIRHVWDSLSHDQRGDAIFLIPFALVLIVAIIALFTWNLASLALK